MTKTKLTTRTSLKTIQSWINSDFGLDVTTSVASAVREAKRTNSLLWGADRIVITNPQIVISERGIRWFNSLYTPAEAKTFEL